ncbi:XkdF-like putative serine protease domain-containing protein [Methanobacterium sp.]|uniref:XkdF-like putative serine protease domain-containing protein n=1 Tax=Methanobacterium sp. TaxID=2164 RepID=UPI0031591601
MNKLKLILGGETISILKNKVNSNQKVDTYMQEGSYEYKIDQVRSAVNISLAESDNPYGDRMWPVRTYPDVAFFEDWKTDKYYQVPYTLSDDGTVTLGEIKEAQREESFSVKFAYPQGSYEELKDSLRTAIRDGLDSTYYVSVRATYPDHVVASIAREDPITYAYQDLGLFDISYTIDNLGKITLGTDITQVQEVKTFEAVKVGQFVGKDDAKRLVTGPVELPGCPDCDYAAGEKIRSAEEVEGFCHSFNDFRISDEMHLFGATGNKIGYAVENWTLKEEITTKNIKGEDVTLPAGTWMATVKVEDDDTWNKIQNGTYQGFSATYLSATDAQKLKDTLRANKSADCGTAILASAKSRTLIKDLVDPTPVTISIVTTPCVPNAIFQSVKSCPVKNKQNSSIKAGRQLSDSNYGKLQSVLDLIKKVEEGAKELLNIGDSEREDPLNSSGTVIDANKSLKEVEDMDEKELRGIISDEVGKSNKEIKEDIEAIKSKIADKKDPDGETAIKCTACNHELEESNKFCPACGDEIKAEESTKSANKIEENPVIKKMMDTQNQIVKVLGIEPKSDKIEGQEELEEKGASKNSDAAFYEAAGLKMNGRPLENK